jgi:hypothetical protein
MLGVKVKDMEDFLKKVVCRGGFLKKVDCFWANTVVG